jgi:hypothetical protein
MRERSSRYWLTFLTCKIIVVLVGVGGSRRDEEFRVTFTTEMSERLERHAHHKDLFVSSLIREIVECWVIDADKISKGHAIASREEAIILLRDEIVGLNASISAMEERKRNLADKLRRNMSES